MADRDPSPTLVHSGQADHPDPDANMQPAAHTAHTPGQRYTGLRVTLQGNGAPLDLVLLDESSAHTLLGYLRRLVNRRRARIER